MTVKKISTLVSTTWLKERIVNLAAHNKTLRVLDTSWTPDPTVDGYTEFYQESHIPTAVHFDLKEIQTKGQQKGHKWPLPEANTFQEYAEELGVSNNTHVIVYDRNVNLPSFRTWFLFRLFGHDNVSVLNGGLVRWLMDGHHVTVEEPEVERGDFTAKFQPQLLRNYNDMLKNAGTKDEQVMDARPKGSFAMNDGHIPGSTNIPYMSLFNNRDMTMKNAAELKELFVSAGVDLNKPLMTTCMTGMTACGLAAAASQLGKEDVPVYSGSFFEWSQLADSSMIERQDLTTVVKTKQQQK